MSDDVNSRGEQAVLEVEGSMEEYFALFARITQGDHTALVFIGGDDDDADPKEVAWAERIVRLLNEEAT